MPQDAVKNIPQVPDSKDDHADHGDNDHVPAKSDLKKLAGQFREDYVGPNKYNTPVTSHRHTGTDSSPISESSLVFSAITTNNVTSTKHGFAPISPADATKFLNGAATPAYAAVKDSDLSTTDITTNNVSTTKHGFAPKAPNVATQFLDGTGAYSTPVTYTIITGTIADNNSVTVSAGGTLTDTVVTHGLGRTPQKVTVGATIRANGGGNSDSFGGGTGVYSSGTSLVSAWYTQNYPNGAFAPSNVIFRTGAQSFQVTATGGNNQQITISVVTITSTQFTFRINGVLVAGASQGSSTVTNISWIAE